MSEINYSLTDAFDSKLYVQDRWTGKVIIATENKEERPSLVHVAPEDAPAVALAILEAAKITERDPAEPDASATPERLALYWLYQWQGLRKAQAEQEAEDAKVKGYRLRLLGSSPETANHRAWSEIDEVQRDLWRRQYRAAREFFARVEKPAPRVLNYGDPEPDRDTKWIKAAGEPITYNGEGWVTRYDRAVAVRWSDYTADQFPMTEVTE